MRPFFWAGLLSGPAALALWWGASSHPLWVDAWFSRGVYPTVVGALSRWAGSFPAVLGLWLIPIVLVILAVTFLVGGWWRGISSILAMASFLLAWFILGWGLNVQRPSWAQLHDWKVEGGTSTSLTALTRELAEKAGELRRKIGPDAKPLPFSVISPAVTSAYTRAGKVDPVLAGTWGPAKLFPIPEVLSWMGISGIFWPFSGEPLVNPGLPDWQKPFTAAHESAHLRGFCREDEANFLAFWVLRDDPDPQVAYSAWSMALLYTASALNNEGEAGLRAWKTFSPTIDPGIFDDWKAADAYWDRYQGPVRKATEAVNDAYLKSQGQNDGVKSYGRMVDLLLSQSGKL